MCLHTGRFQLQVEAAALRAEEGLDALSTERLVAVKAELVELQLEQVALEQGYAEAKAVLGQLADCRREIEDTQWAIGAKTPFLEHIQLKRSFCQDRLGTNIGKVERQEGVFRRGE